MSKLLIQNLEQEINNTTALMNNTPNHFPKVKREYQGQIKRMRKQLRNLKGGNVIQLKNNRLL